ncbi:MAG TPA: hypothetical protein DCY49_03360 [Candidatus Jacksonbacteria bacterium]|uniref:Putative disulfide formation protein n=1 Tax=candidate division CPR1 bacterium GW2011_GWA2_42_17 TaxID=1618341 RepID=A0A0G1C3T7_9BACT|nr:MAG: putative disulfide formation protein [candidate division CPR1 bacterium GW2011_GWA2_42_17]HAZ16914.1 hypothetical protein [Candidatus Jacksonbacteria bacterium]
MLFDPTFLVSLGALILQGLLVCVIVSVILRLHKKSRIHALLSLIGKNGALIIFILSGGAALGTLYLSEVLKYAPCSLCWYQRAFLFPQVVVAGLAYLRQYPRKILSEIILALSVVGALIAVYHTAIYFKSRVFVSAVIIPCDLTGVSCTVQYFTYFGYITIPVISLTMFATLIVVSLIMKKYDR